VGLRVAAIASAATLRSSSLPCGRGPRPLLCQCRDLRSERLAVNVVTIEVAVDQFLEFSVSLMSGVGTHAATLRPSLELDQFHGKSSLSLWTL
jgi:hypothetical protein